jgi:hypothetical protein
MIYVGKKLTEWGAYLLVFLLPWQTVWIIRQATIGSGALSGPWQYGAIQIYAVEVLVWVLVLFWFLSAGYVRLSHPGSSLREWRRSQTRHVDLCIIAALLLAALSLLWAQDRAVAFAALVHSVEGALLFFLYRSVPLKLSLLAGAWIAAASIQGALALWQVGAQMIFANTILGIATQDPATLGTAVIQAGDRRMLRAYGSFPHPNVLGAYLAVSMAWCPILLRLAREKWQWLIILGASQVILAGLLVSFSRGAWIAALAGSGTALAVRFFCRKESNGYRRQELAKQTKPPIVISPLVIFVLLCAMMVGIFSVSFFDELRVRAGIQRTRLEDQSIDERISLFVRSAPLLREVWYRGTGIGNFTNSLFVYERDRAKDRAWYTYQPLHNVLGMIGAELGIVGAIVFVAVALFLILAMPVMAYPLIGTLATLSLFDHFLWTLPVGIFMVSMTLGVLVRKDGEQISIYAGRKEGS